MSDTPSAKEIFSDALDLPADQREAFVDRACAGREGLRAKVRELLAAHRAAGGFLGSPTIEPVAVTPAPPGHEAVGSLIGRYKLLQLIGEGGFGSVFMAEQREPVARRVALKIIKLGMDTRQVVARFEAERQALALMDHPNIARVFDGGATESGRPYFVMELVRGEPITTYCDTNHLSTPERIELFLDVCRAVQHAHQKGVIHRDLKPSNILVTLIDGRAVPKVIDFGIAKATSARLTEKTVFTEFRQMIGTPEYMSPEQAELSSVDIDTRSDVYALGVVLYELLTGTTPFEGARLRSAAFAEMQRIIREDEPPVPSARLTTAKTSLASAAALRRTEPARLVGLVRGDLDWIAMKCLEKDRSRRYDSPGSLAADLGRHLAGEAVTAAPPSTAYRARKFIRRNRAAVVASGLIVGALALGTVGTSIGLVKANSARVEEAKQRAAADQSAGEARDQAVRATESEKAARRQADRAQRLSRVLRETLEGVGPSVAKGRDTAVLREMMDNVAARLTKGEFADDPISEIDLRLTIGEVLLRIGASADAAHALEPAVDLARSQGAQGMRGLAASLLLLAHSDVETSRVPQAESHALEAVAVFESLGDAHRDDLARSHIALGVARGAAGRGEEAIAEYRLAAEIMRRVGTPGNTVLADALSMIATEYTRLGQVKEAETALREAIAAGEQAGGGEQTELLALQTNLAHVLVSQGRFAEAEPILRRSVAEGTVLYPEGHHRLAAAHGGLAKLLHATGKLPEAEINARAAVEMLDRSAHPEDQMRAPALSELGLILSEQNKWPEAKDVLTRSVDLYRRSFPGDHRDTATALNNLASAMSGLGDQTNAIALYREVLAMRRRLFQGDSLTLAISANNLAAALVETEKYDDAEPYYAEALAMAQRLYPAGHPLFIATECGLGSVTAARGKGDETLAHFDAAMKVADSLYQGDHPIKARVLSRRAKALAKLGRKDEALQAANAAVDLASRVLPAGHPLITEYTGIRDAIAGP